MPSLADITSKVKIVYETSGADAAVKGLRDFASAQQQAVTASTQYSTLSNTIAGSFNNLKSSAGNWALGIAGIGAAFIAGTAALTSFISAVKTGIEEFTKFQQYQVTTTNALQATGFAAGRSTEQLLALADSLGGDVNKTREAITALMQFNSVGGDTFDRTLRMAQNLAASGFGSISSAATKMGQVLSGESKALEDLNKRYQLFSYTREQALVSMLQSGNVQQIASAANQILSQMEQRFAGTGAAQLNTITAAWDSLTSALQRGSEQLGSAAANYLHIADSINAIAKAITWLNSLDLTAIARLAAGGIAGMATGAFFGGPLGAAAGAAIGLGATAGRLSTELQPPTGPAQFGLSGPEVARARFAQQRAAQYQADKDAAEAAQKLADAQARAAKAYEQRMNAANQVLDQERLEITLINASAGAQEEARRNVQAYYQLKQIASSTGTAFNQKEFDQLKQINSQIKDLVNTRTMLTQLSSAIEGPLVSGLTNVVNGTKRASSAFKDMANQIITQIEQVIIKLAIVQPLMNAVFGPVGSILGGAASGGSSGSFSFNPGQNMKLSWPFHTGGIVGIDGVPRWVHSDYFDNAPRFHSGGLAGDEVPIIARRGEGVFTPGQMAAMGGGGGITVNVHNAPAGVDSVTKSSGSQGATIDIVLKRAVENVLLNDLANYGKISQGMTRRYGVDPVRGLG